MVFKNLSVLVRLFNSMHFQSHSSGTDSINYKIKGFQMSYKTQYQVAQEELQKLLKIKEKTLGTYSSAAAEELQAKINTATINALFAYGT